jgi:hypothetical protein
MSCSTTTTVLPAPVSVFNCVINLQHLRRAVRWSAHPPTQCPAAAAVIATPAGHWQKTHESHGTPRTSAIFFPLQVTFRVSSVNERVLRLLVVLIGLTLTAGLFVRGG